MKKFNNDLNDFERLFGEKGWLTFTIDGCKCAFNPNVRPPELGSSSESKGTYYMYVQKYPDSTDFINCAFELKLDYEINKKTNRRAPKKSPGGNAYFGMTYLAKKHPDNKEWMAWKSRGMNGRYPRFTDACRCCAGIFLDSGVTVDQICQGVVKYDDLSEYVKAYMKGEKALGRPFDISTKVDDLDFMEEVAPEKDKNLPYDNFDAGFDLPFEDLFR